MNITQFLVEIYIGNALVGRQEMILPIIVAIQQCVDICKQAYQDSQPIMIVFTNENLERLEYKNPSYIRFEKGE